MADSISGSRMIFSSGNLVGRIVIAGDRECYSGDCHIIPKVEEQVLETRDKLMTDNITVTSIPYYEVSNPQGGTTVIIGGNNNGND